MITINAKLLKRVLSYFQGIIPKRSVQENLTMIELHQRGDKLTFTGKDVFAFVRHTITLDEQPAEPQTAEDIRCLADFEKLKKVSEVLKDEVQLTLSEKNLVVKSGSSRFKVSAIVANEPIDMNIEYGKQKIELEGYDFVTALNTIDFARAGTQYSEGTNFLGFFRNKNGQTKLSVMASDMYKTAVRFDLAEVSVELLEPFIVPPLPKGVKDNIESKMLTLHVDAPWFLMEYSSEEGDGMIALNRIHKSWLEKWHQILEFNIDANEIILSKDALSAAIKKIRAIGTDLAVPQKVILWKDNEGLHLYSQTMEGKHEAHEVLSSFTETLPFEYVEGKRHGAIVEAKALDEAAHAIPADEVRLSIAAVIDEMTSEETKLFQKNRMMQLTDGENHLFPIACVYGVGFGFEE